MASDPQVRRAAFVHHWRLLGCHGTPRSPQFYDTATLGSFCRQHALGHCDSLSALAVRHSASLHELKRLNLLMSEHSLHSRTHIYTPGACVHMYVCLLYVVCLSVQLRLVEQETALVQHPR